MSTWTSRAGIGPLPFLHQHSDRASAFCPKHLIILNTDEARLAASTDAERSKASAPAPLSENMSINPMPSPPPEPAALAQLTPDHDSGLDFASMQFQQIIGLPRSPNTGEVISAKAPRALRLPSFESLGIARRPTQLFAGSSGLHGIGSPHKHPPFSPKIDEALFQDSSLSQQGLKAVKSFVLTYTPPDDSGNIDWDMPDVKVAANPASAPISDSGTTLLRSSGTEQDSIADFKSSTASSSSCDSSSARAPWLSKALQSILSIVHEHKKSDAIKILSHALPSPSTSGHAFPTVIDSILQSTSSSSIMWMNVWHCVSGRFKFEDLPKSPPTTPAPPFEGDDYFTQRVFDYAVEVPDYSHKLVAQPLTPRPQRPAIAPNSIDMSIVERYIPPTSTAEFEELFSATGRSFLNDRLIELSPAHGTLLFVYPTRAGGNTFTQSYLDPVLAPALRTMIISHDLPSHLAMAVGNMDAVADLPTFDDMKSQLEEFLNTLSNGGGSTPRRFRLHGATYDLVYAAPQEVCIDRAVWAKEWWTKQEKTRIQRVFESHDLQSTMFTRQAGAFQASEHLAIATVEAHQATDHARLIQRAQTQALLREAERSRGQRHPGDNEQMILRLLDEVATKPYPEKIGPPKKGVEVGVFVIQKRLRDTLLA